MKRKFNIDSDISKAETLPSSFYKDLKIFEELKTKIFLKSWQWVGDSDLVKEKNSVYPQLLLEDYLTEPIVLTRDESDTIHCLTNVCTHRGNILVFEPGKSKKLVCMYHGRRFNNKGDFEFMPSLTKSIALFSLLLILLLNIFGVKKVEKTHLLIVSISVLSLIGLIIFGFGSFDGALT